MIFNKFSVQDTSILKAISIIFIVLHNALHPIYRPLKVCNEFDFSILRMQFFWDSVSSNFFALPNCILMAFGYSGVAYFFFFSAYGLAFKFCKSESIPYWAFVKARLVKLYIPILLSTAFLLIFIYFFGKHGTHTRLSLYHLLLQLATLINFTSSYDAVIVGPWWFLGAIIQLYLVFHVLMWGTLKYGNYFLLSISAFSVLLLMLLNNILLDYIYLKKNIIGWLPEIALGIYFVRARKMELTSLQAAILATLCLFLYLIGNMYEFFWYFSSFAILLFCVIVSHPILSFVHRFSWLDNSLIYIGKISIYMFLVNGIIREPIIEFFSRPESSILIHSIWALVILFLSFFVAAILMLTQQKVTLALTRGAS